MSNYEYQTVGSSPTDKKNWSSPIVYNLDVKNNATINNAIIANHVLSRQNVQGAANIATLTNNFQTGSAYFLQIQIAAGPGSFRSLELNNSFFAGFPSSANYIWSWGSNSDPTLQHIYLRNSYATPGKLNLTFENTSIGAVTIDFIIDFLVF